MLDGINVTESLRGPRGRQRRQQPRDVTVGKWLKKKREGKKWHGRLRTVFIASKRKKQWGEIRPLKTGHTLSVSRGPPPHRLPFRAVAADGESARLGSFANKEPNKPAVGQETQKGGRCVRQTHAGFPLRSVRPLVNAA